MSEFTLHPQLEQDGIPVCDLPLCRCLLMNDSNYPWFILVPRRDDKREIYELDEADQLQLNKESSWLAHTTMQLFDGHKMNVAALGNMVPQLHIHHIVRYESDPAWPGPVWGKVAASHYTDIQAQTIIDQLLARLAAGEL